MPINIVVPQLSESVVEATVLRWLKKEGEKVSIGESVVELETEKANFEVASEQTGVLARIEKPAGQDVRVGDVLGVLAEGAAAEAKTAAAEPKPAEQVKQAPVAHETAAKVTPVAANTAKELGVDTSKVPATGPSGRVMKGDVEKFAEVRAETKPAPIDTQKKADAAPLQIYTADPRGEQRVRMTRRRRTIARRMVEAQRTAAILTTFNEVDMTAVMNLRKRRKDSFKEKFGVGLGLNSFFIKASIGALKAFPQINGEIQDDDVIFKNYYDIGVAIGASEGLVVPVIRDADRLSFAQIEKAIKVFADKADKGTLTIQDMLGGTFTITNGGVFGSLMSTPILNPPQVGILGLHKIEDRPMAVKGEIVVRPMMYIALSYDHRMVDGREAVQFLVKVKELVEDPESLLIEG
ncbi:MAG: 2-oxoglutarate dehydrogenase complex dihydrolipoyllysine-residue succinyltransferase [Deltaproteobacteria bacterium]